MAKINKNPRHADLKAPGSRALLSGAVTAIANGDNPFAQMGVAIGVCWRGPGRPKTRITANHLGDYGAKVYDELMAREDVSAEDIDVAAARAYDLLLEAIGGEPSASEVAEVEGNSGAAQEVST